MPRNLKGGNKAKKGANKNLIPKAIIEAGEGQYYGIVTQYHGSGRCELTYIMTDFKTNKQGNFEESVSEIKVKGILRGSLKKKVRLTNGDIILITPRDYQSDVVDIINKYSNDDIQKLRKQQIASSNLFKIRDSVLCSKISTSKQNSKEDDDLTFGYDEEDEFNINENYNENRNIKQKSYDTYASIYNDMPSFEDEDYSE